MQSPLPKRDFPQSNRRVANAGIEEEKTAFESVYDSIWNRTSCPQSNLRLSTVHDEKVRTIRHRVDSFSNLNPNKCRSLGIRLCKKKTREAARTRAGIEPVPCCTVAWDGRYWDDALRKTLYPDDAILQPMVVNGHEIISRTGKKLPTHIAMLLLIKDSEILAYAESGMSSGEYSCKNKKNQRHSRHPRTRPGIEPVNLALNTILATAHGEQVELRTSYPTIRAGNRDNGVLKRGLDPGTGIHPQKHGCAFRDSGHNSQHEIQDAAHGIWNRTRDPSSQYRHKLRYGRKTSSSRRNVQDPTRNRTGSLLNCLVQEANEKQVEFALNTTLMFMEISISLALGITAWNEATRGSTKTNPSCLALNCGT
ncbi:hypothetical protein DFH06DRAFT_1131490 [Mycena polygramma]|nr:hypothetical protein DFH06DRAFT_1131490 [Mycena polygramma]